MANPFMTISERLLDLGFFNFFLPWLITTAMFYGMLKKSGMFKSEGITAILSLSIGFFVWSYLSLGGMDLSKPLSTFFMQGSAIMLVVIIGVVASSVFYPDFTGVLKEHFSSRNMVWVIIALFFGLFFTSGLSGILAGQPTPSGTAKHDVALLVNIIVILLILTLILVGSTRAGGG